MGKPVKVVLEKSKSSNPIEEGEDRTCTDVIFLLLFLLFWVGMIVIAYLAYQRGEPNRLLYGYDMEGNICGMDNTVADSSKRDMSKKPYLYYPTMKDLSVQICVPNCPVDSFPAPVMRSQAVCLYTVPETLGTVDLAIAVASGKCWGTYRSTDMFHRCVPTLTAEDRASKNATEIEEDEGLIRMSKARDISAKFFGDLNRCKWVIGGACFVAIFLGFCWLMLLRVFAGFIVWSTIYAVIGAFTWIVIKFWRCYKEEQAHYEKIPEGERTEEDADDMNAFEVLFYVFLVIDILLILIILGLYTRIRLAIAIIQEASKAMQDTPFLVFFPVVIFIILIVFMAYWLVIAMFLATASVEQYDKVTGEFEGYHSDDTLRYMQIYHFFGFLWNTEFWLAVLQCTIASAIARWYFTTDKANGLPNWPVSAAFGQVLRYHVGSLALGSLIIAVVQFLRRMLGSLEKNMKSHLDNDLIHFLFKCVQCLFKCAERFLKFINKNAYIQMAIYGDPFCTSARRAFELLTHNIARVGTVNAISEFLMFLGRCFISVMSGVTAFYAMDILVQETIYYKSVVIGIIMLLTYYLGAAFMEIYDMAIDTILLCFCEDEERNNGKDKPYFMSDDLKQFVNESEKAALERKMEIKRRTAKVTPVDD